MIKINYEKNTNLIGGKKGLDTHSKIGGYFFAKLLTCTSK